MAIIDIGSDAIDRASYQDNTGASFVDKANPADGTGILDTFEVFAIVGISGLKTGTFSVSGTSCTYRDHENIGSVSSGSKQTFTGKSCSVSSSDCLGWLIASGQIEQSYPGTALSLYKLSYDAFSSGTHTIDGNSSNLFLSWSVYATGATVAAGSLPLKNVFGRPFSGVFR